MSSLIDKVADEDEVPEPSSDIEEEEEEPQSVITVPQQQVEQPKPIPNRIELLPSDFYFGKTLGEGAFARVVHAKSKKAGTEFAIKIMEKIHIKRENKDAGYLYMCMDLAPGGVLSDLISIKLSEKLDQHIFDQACDFYTTQFYIAEIIEALEYIHGKGIIHRDLKPENVLFDRQGHIKIGDFGTASIMDDENGPRTSFVGTQDYVSPEVLTGDRDATKASDLWAVGCMLFQMLTGISPFHGETEYLTFELIMGHCRGAKELEYPETIPEAAKDLIGKILKGEESERIGAGDDETNGYPALKNHRFFESIPWGNLINTPAPYQPDPKSFPDPNNMRDGALDEWLLEGEPTPITSYLKKSDIIEPHSKAQDRGIWDKFLLPGENQVFTGLIYKRKGLFSKKRQLVLTDVPRLIYIDPDTMELKGEIPWTKSQPVSCIIKTPKEFDVKCSITQRMYHLTDNEVGSQVWIDFINELLAKQQCS